MTAVQSSDRLYDIVAGALDIWGLRTNAEVLRDGPGVRIEIDGSPVVTIAPAPASEPERWIVEVAAQTDDEILPRETLHRGTPGMLRALRAALTGDWQWPRMIVAPPPLTE